MLLSDLTKRPVSFPLLTAFASKDKANFFECMSHASKHFTFAILVLCVSQIIANIKFKMAFACELSIFKKASFLIQNIFSFSSKVHLSFPSKGLPFLVNIENLPQSSFIAQGQPCSTIVTRVTCLTFSKPSALYFEFPECVAIRLQNSPLKYTARFCILVFKILK